MAINWVQDLGSPSEPCEVMVEGIGVVVVTERDIRDAKAIGGEPDVELIEDDTFRAGPRVPRFGILRFDP